MANTNTATCYVCAAGHNCAEHSRRTAKPAPVVPVWATLAVSSAAARGLWLRSAQRWRDLAKDTRARASATPIPYGHRIYQVGNAQARAELDAADPPPARGYCWEYEGNRVCEAGTKGCCRTHPSR